MSLESNKKDFEGALEVMKEILEDMQPCIDDVLLDKLTTVITNYEGHYLYDIQDLIHERDTLQDKVDMTET